MVEEQYNDDELHAPEWMNKEFFEKILRETDNDDSIKVQEVQMKPGSAKGDHYGSIMFRAIINYECKNSKNQEKSLIVKTMPFVDGPKKEMLQGMNIFDIEIKMYNEIIPKFQKILKDSGDNTELGGKCLYAATEPQEILIFEDLTKKNYKTVTNWGGSWEVGKKAVEKLAKWHAMSFKMVNDGDDSLQKFNKNGFTDDKIKEVPMFVNGFSDFVKMLKTKPEFEKYAPKFEKLSTEDPISKTQVLFNAFINGDKANLFVLNHGDFHIKNLMFTEKDDGKVDEVLLVDFQLCIWGPAVIDLIYMLYMMMDGESRINRRNEIIHYYFETFTETLKKLKFSGEYPKLTNLYKDFITYKDFELLMLTTMLPFITAIQEDPTLDIGQVMHGNDDIRKSFYENENYLTYVRQILPILLYTGFLD
ncbi:hypothetical protein ACFFRR_010582 [Megaselia abdita]